MPSCLIQKPSKGLGSREAAAQNGDEAAPTPWLSTHSPTGTGYHHHRAPAAAGEVLGLSIRIWPFKRMTNLAQLLSGYEDSHQYSCTITDATYKTSSNIISFDQVLNKH